MTFGDLPDPTQTGVAILGDVLIFRREEQFLLLFGALGRLKLLFLFSFFVFLGGCGN